MKRKRILVTGGNAGIGYETVKALANQGHEVIMLSRSKAKGEAALQELLAAQPSADIKLMVTDLGSQKAIRQLAEELTDRYETMDVLINNAGTWISDLTYTEDEIETVLAVNHFAPFLLSHLLLPLLERAEDGRIINVASDSHMQVKDFDFDDPFLSKKYHGLKSYAHSKLANVMFTYGFEKKKGNSKVTIYAVQPGLVYTDIGLKRTTWLHAFAWKVRRTLWKSKSAAEGADTSIFLATDPDVSKQSGLYWDLREPKKSSDGSYRAEDIDRLWDWSLEKAKIKNYFDP